MASSNVNSPIDASPSPYAHLPDNERKYWESLEVQNDIRVATEKAEYDALHEMHKKLIKSDNGGEGKLKRLAADARSRSESKCMLVNIEGSGRFLVTIHPDGTEVWDIYTIGMSIEPNMSFAMRVEQETNRRMRAQAQEEDRERKRLLEACELKRRVAAAAVALERKRIENEQFEEAVRQAMAKT
jgi:hypothetical protein